MSKSFRSLVAKAVNVLSKWVEEIYTLAINKNLTLFSTLP